VASVWQIRKLFALALVLFLLSCDRTAQEYIERARKLAAAGKYADASLTLRKAIQKDPRFGEAHYQLGLTELQLGHPREAYRALTEAATLLPARADVQAALGGLILKAYLSDRTRPKLIYDQLTKISQQLLAADPKSFDGLKIKACLAVTDSKVEEALGLFQQANAVRPLDPELTMLWVQALTTNRQDAEAEKLALELLEKNKSYGPVYDFLFRRYLATGRIAKAQNTIETKVRNNPDEVAYALELAAYYASAGKRDQMNITIRSLLDRSASFPEVHLQVGDFYSGFQEWELALQQYDEGAKAHPKDKLVYLKRFANVWLRQGKGEQAAGMVDQILKENPQDEEGRAIKASIDMKSGDPKKLDAALSAFQDLVAKSPANPVLRLTLGHTFMAKGNAEAARAQYLEILKRNNDYAPALLAMAELTRSRNEFTETLRYADELLRLNPNQRPARLLRASALIGAGDSIRARNELTRVLKDFPGTREAELELASLDATQKKFPEAEARLRKLLAEKPGDPAALAALAETLTAADQPRKALDLLSGELKRSPESEVTRIMLADTAARIGESDMAIEQ
jgi:predicted Zn-dependent protease